MHQVKIGWFGDSQLDYAQYGLTRRRDDFIAALDRALQDMHGQGVSTVVHTGDFLQSNRPSPFCMKALQVIQHWLEDRNMVVLVVSGNHDNARPHWLDVVNGGSPLGFQLLDYKLESRQGITFQGVPNVSRDTFLKTQFVAADILVMHQAITQFIDYPSTNAINVAELPLDKYQVIAIGDTHIYKVDQAQTFIAENPPPCKCLVGSSGATELNSESEQDDKYWVELIFQANDGAGYKLTGHRPHQIQTRPILRIQIEDASQLNSLVDDTKRKVEGLRIVDIREPIIFIRYNSLVPDVIERFRKNFDPDKFILRLHPLFRTAGEKALVSSSVDETISITELLQAQVPPDSNLYALASQLFNPDLEMEHVNAAIDHYVEERLQTTTN